VCVVTPHPLHCWWQQGGSRQWHQTLASALWGVGGGGGGEGGSEGKGRGGRHILTRTKGTVLYCTAS
jgi:hypothetical protein